MPYVAMGVGGVCVLAIGVPESRFSPTVMLAVACAAMGAVVGTVSGCGVMLVGLPLTSVG